MKKTNNKPTAPLYLRPPLNLDTMLEEMTGIERRTKSAIISLALELYVQTNHPGLLAKYKEVTT